MSLGLTLQDFQRLAATAAQSPDCDFDKSQVGRRLGTVFANRHFEVRPQKLSLELRRDLALRINDIYRTDGGVRIPTAVARALNVDKSHSGFKLGADGSLVATNHPLTDRRLVVIMAALELDVGRFPDRLLVLGEGLENFISDSSRAPVDRMVAQNYLTTLRNVKKLLDCIAGGGLRRGQIRMLLDNIRQAVDTVRRHYTDLQDRLAEDGRQFLGWVADEFTASLAGTIDQIDQLPQLRQDPPMPIVVDEAPEDEPEQAPMPEPPSVEQMAKAAEKTRKEALERRKVRNGGFVQRLKANFEKSVAEAIVKELGNLASDENAKSLRAGIANLKKDFPSLASWGKQIKADHMEGKVKSPLPLIDVLDYGVLRCELAGKVEGFKPEFDGFDLALSMDGIRELSQGVARKAAAEIVARLKEALDATVFEDRRTELVLMALDSAKAEAFTKKLAEAKEEYQDKAVARFQLDMVEDKIEVQKRSRNYAKDDNSRLRGSDSDLGEKMRGKIRNFYADLFARPPKNAPDVKKFMRDHFEEVQLMLGDPSLVDVVSIPGENADGAAVKQLTLDFLAKLSPLVNMGKLPVAALKTAIANALDSAELVDPFVKGIDVAGNRLMKHLQAQFTDKLTNVLRRISAGGGKDLQLADKTLAELGAKGLGSMDRGYGKFLGLVLDNYFAAAKGEARLRMLESFYRNGKSGGTIGDALGALIKGAGPIFQKVLQSIHLEGLPEDIRKTLGDVKSRLAEIDKNIVADRINRLVEESGGKVERIEIGETLGAASVGQAIMCTVFAAGETEGKRCVVKMSRPGIEERAKSERGFFETMAAKVGPAMVKTFQTRMDSIMQELDFTNEKKWIEKGACYGNSRLYNSVKLYGGDKVAAPAKTDEDDDGEIKDRYRLGVNSMTASSLLPAKKDVLVLDVAEGRPLDRCNREDRRQLDKLVGRFSKQIWTDDGQPQTVYRAGNVYEFAEGRHLLTEMYRRVADRHKMLLDLVRRFSEEIFARNRTGKGDAGGFMHGDLHGGNLLVSDNRLTVIDFGNSHQFSLAERDEIVRFVAACGYSRADLALEAIATLLKVKPTELGVDYGELQQDISIILSKGTGNDIASRGMAVVQYLQQKNVQVPGPIFNFTETVMRLSSAIDETASLLDTIAETINSLEFSTVNDDPFSTFNVVPGQSIYAGYNASYFDPELKNGKILYNTIDNNQRVLYMNRHQSDFKPKTGLNEAEYVTMVAPMIGALKNLHTKFSMEGPNGKLSIGETVRNLEVQFKRFGKHLFDEPGTSDESARSSGMILDMLFRLSNCYREACMMVKDSAETDARWFHDVRKGLNDAMSDGLRQAGKVSLMKILGRSSLSMAAGAEDLLDEGDRETMRLRVAVDAQRFYLGSHGQLPMRVVRFLDRFVSDHFTWPHGKCEEFFSESRAGKWFEPKLGKLEPLAEAIRLNLAKLRSGLASANIEEQSSIIAYAMINFGCKFGLAEALAKMEEKEYAAFIDSFKGEERDLLMFLRRDPDIVKAQTIGRCRKEADMLLNRESLEQLSKLAANDLKPLGVKFTKDNFRDETYFPALAESLNQNLEIIKWWCRHGSGKNLQTCIRFAFLSYAVQNNFIYVLKKLNAEELKYFFARLIAVNKKNRELTELFEYALKV